MVAESAPLPPLPLAGFVAAVAGAQLLGAWNSLVTVLPRVQLARMAQEHPRTWVRKFLAKALDHPLRHGLAGPLAIHGCLLTAFLLSLKLGASWPEAIGLGAGLIILQQAVPKLLITLAPDWAATISVPVHTLAHYLLKPLTVPIAAALGWLGALREEVAGEEERSPAEVQQEVDALINLGAREGIIEPGDRELIRGAIDFGDSVAREVMTPRTDLVALAKDATLADLLAVLVENRHTRIPLHGESLDEIVGVLYVKDIYPMIEVGAFDAPLLPHARPPVFTPASKPLHALLQELRMKREQLAIVVDEYGGTAGLLTLEDLLECIVGDIADPHEESTPDFVRAVDGSLTVAASLPLAELNQKTGWELSADGVETAGGWLITHLGRIPQGGEKVKAEGREVEVLEAEPRRVLRMKFPARA